LDTKSIKMQKMALFTSATLVLATMSIAYAWGGEGHQVFTLISESKLTPKGKVERLVEVPYIQRLASILGRRLAVVGTRLLGVLNAVLK
jgi:hypothetical protein